MAYYSSSSYGTKYTKTIANERGVSVTLNIKRRGYSGRTYQIGELQSINFQIQGNDEVTSPIVKTNLQVTLVDDMFSPGIDSSGIKYDGSAFYRCGNWKEFYTPDSTLYLVEVYYGSSTALWRGYITPDSYSEALDAYGSVTITARDNIGHLQDFDFDLDGDTSGLLNVSSFIETAFTKIAFPMTLNKVGFSSSNDRYLISEDGGYYIKDLYFNAAALKGKTYYDALEEILNSLGMCLRFTGHSTFYLSPLRTMPFLGYNEGESSSDPQTSFEVEFYGRRSGTRTFEPAYRQIVENVNFEQEDDYVPEILFMKEGATSTSMRTFVDATLVINPTTPDGTQYSGVMIAAEQALGRYVSASSYPSNRHGWSTFPRVNILNDEAYALQDYTAETEGDGMHNYLFLTANCGTYSTSGGITFVDINHQFARKIRTAQIDVTISFAEHPAGFDENGKLGVYFSHILAKVEYYVYYVRSGMSMYWNGTRWQYGTTGARLSYTNDTYSNPVHEVSFSLSECEELGQNGYLYIRIAQIAYYASNCKWIEQASEKYGNYTPDTWQPRGLYARLKSITFSAKSIKKKVQSDTVTTICNTAYNVRCERNPLLGFLPITVNFVDPLIYKNAFFVYDSSSNIQAAPYRWRWNTDSVALPFPVKIHQQLLMYHYTTEELLEGDCGEDVSSGVSRKVPIEFDSIVEYKGVNHLIKSCTLDLIKNRLTSAQLRSYKHYADLWDGSETYSDDKIS